MLALPALPGFCLGMLRVGQGRRPSAGRGRRRSAARCLYNPTLYNPTLLLLLLPLPLPLLPRTCSSSGTG